MVQLARAARPASSRPRPSVPTSPETACTRLVICSKPSVPSSSRRRSKQSLRRISFCTRCSAELRRPSRTNNTSWQSGTQRSSRSTSAVPTKPVPPVMKIRWPLRFSRIMSASPPRAQRRRCGVAPVGHGVRWLGAQVHQSSWDKTVQLLATALDTSRSV